MGTGTVYGEPGVFKVLAKGGRNQYEQGSQPLAPQNPPLADLGKGNDTSSWNGRLPLKHGTSASCVCQHLKLLPEPALCPLSRRESALGNQFLGWWI